MYVGILLAVVLFGMFLLLLTVGYRTSEEARRRQEEERALEPLRDLEPKFFGPRLRRAGANQSAARWREEAVAVPSAQVDALVDDVERFLRVEQLLAQRFVDEPSVGTLHRRTHRVQWNRTSGDPPVPVEVSPDAVVKDMERALRQERFLAELFVVDPSIGNLHRATESVCSTN